jgi:hypothetical protein
LSDVSNLRLLLLLPLLAHSAVQLETPLKIYGVGTNVLPMIHVDDAAAYLTALCGPPLSVSHGMGPYSSSPSGLLAGLPESQQYVLAVDCPGRGMPGGVTQGDLVHAIASSLGTGAIT